MYRGERDKHLLNCSKRLVNCSICQASVTQDEMSSLTHVRASHPLVSVCGSAVTFNLPTDKALWSTRLVLKGHGFDPAFPLNAVVWLRVEGDVLRVSAEAFERGTIAEPLSDVEVSITLTEQIGGDVVFPSRHFKLSTVICGPEGGIQEAMSNVRAVFGVGKVVSCHLNMYDD